MTLLAYNGPGVTLLACNGLRVDEARLEENPALRVPA